jgi:hypothetical protein
MKLKLSLGGAALAVAALIGGAVAWACVPGASITLSQTSGPPGTTVTISGGTFDAQGSPVNLYFGGTSGAHLGQAPVLTDRSFQFTFTVPAELHGARTGGAHVVSATQLDRNGLAYNPVNRTFTVTGASRPATAPNLQGPAQAEQPDGAQSTAPAGQPGAARATSPAAAAGAPSAPAQAATGQAAQPGSAAGAPATAPQIAAAQAAQAATQPAGSQEAFKVPATAPAPEAATARSTSESDSNRSPVWVLAALGLLAGGFLAAGTGIFVAERRRARVTA